MKRLRPAVSAPLPLAPLALVCVHLLLLMLVAVGAQDATLTAVVASSAIGVKYSSSSAPLCADAGAQEIAALYGANSNIYDQCVADAHSYSFFPYSGRLPSDSQILAMVSSLACLQFFQAALLLPVAHTECNLGGLDLRSALETLLMTSQDVVADVAPLTSDQLLQFISWRQKRNVAQEAGEPFDTTTESAVAFDKQVADVAARLQVSLSAQLEIQVSGRAVGVADDDTVAGDAEISSGGDQEEEHPPSMVPSEGEISPNLEDQGPTSSGTSAADAFSLCHLIAAVGALLLFVWCEPC